MLLNKYQYNNSLKKKNNKEFYKTIKTLIPQTLITSLIYNIQNDINEKEVEYKKISIQDKKEKLKNELTELFDDEEDQEEVEELIIINKEDDKEEDDKEEDDKEDDDEDEDEEELSYWPDTSGWFIIITFFIIGAWQSWGDLIYYTFWSFIGYWIGVGLFAGVVDWIVDKLKEE